jgi:hypothetical protein
MRVFIAVVALTAGFYVTTCESAFSGERTALLTPQQRRVYHACLYSAWVQDYCRWNSLAFGACVIGNGGGQFAFAGRRSTDDYCWYYAAQNAPLRW